jgi:hypothetical protein
MRKLTTAVLTTTFTLALAFAFTPSAYPTFVRESCSCSAPDGSCSASVTCTGGCTKFCGNNDNCSASCSGHYGFLDTEVTLEMQNATYSQFVTELAHTSGKDITFTPTIPNMRFNAGFKRATLWDALRLLSDQGTVQVAGQDFEKLKRLRRSLLTGEKFSFCVTNTPVNTFVNDLAGLTGLSLRITAGRPTATVNVKLQEVALSDMIRAVSEQTGTKIIEEGTDSTGR